MAPRSGKKVTRQDIDDGEGALMLGTKKIGHYVVRGAIIIIPLGVFLWFAGLLYHSATTGDWDGYREQGASAIKLAIPYGVGLLTRFGFMDKKED